MVGLESLLRSDCGGLTAEESQRIKRLRLWLGFYTEIKGGFSQRDTEVHSW